jgi:hypothetical protein
VVHRERERERERERGWRMLLPNETLQRKPLDSVGRIFLLKARLLLFISAEGPQTVEQALPVEEAHRLIHAWWGSCYDDGFDR